MLKWTNKLPKPKVTQTTWWFYGWQYGKMNGTDDTPQLGIMECYKTDSGYTRMCNGQFWYESEAIGIFAEFESPKLPTDDELKKMVSPEV